MKKRLLISLLATMLLPIMVSCGKNDNGNDESVIVESESEELEFNQKVTFFIDYWHSSEVFYEMQWYMGKPLGSCPEACQLTDADATDPLFPHFLGWSQYSSSIDDSKIWNFETDSKIGSSLKLYGIWVAED